MLENEKKRQDCQNSSLKSCFPHVLTLETEKKKLDYLSNLFESVYLLDILERHRVKNKSEFEDLVRIVASSIGAPTNTTKLSNTFKSVKKVAISYNTIDKYLGYMQDAFIIEKATRFDIKGKKYIGSLAKYYFTSCPFSRRLCICVLLVQLAQESCLTFRNVLDIIFGKRRNKEYLAKLTASNPFSNLLYYCISHRFCI